MNKKGFTLIELLAVIVILAIIALIATPIILGIIKDAKEESNKRSIDGYANAVKNAIAKQQLQNPNEIVKGNFTSTNGGKQLKQANEIKLTVEYDGNVVCDIIKVYEDGNIYITECQVNGAKVKYAYGIKKYYEDGEIVYFDVKDGVGCTENDYHEDNSITGYNGLNGTDNQNSCLKFYAFLDYGSDRLNLLLDHNTADRSIWASPFNTEGPDILLKSINSATKDWKGTLVPESQVIKILKNSNIIEHTIDYSKTPENETKAYTARGMTLYEVLQIIGVHDSETINNVENYSQAGWYTYWFQNLSFDSETGIGSVCAKSGCKYAWLYDRTNGECTTYGCLNNGNSNYLNGFWTVSPYIKGEYGAWCVKYQGGLLVSSIDQGSNTDCGTRPVIEVLKSKLK